MNNIENVFKKSKAYVGYVTAGDGGLDRSLEMMLAMVEGGVNILEVGVPFSDPVADGPTIQAAAMRALKNNISVDDVLSLVKKFREHSAVPVVLFSYYNPIFQASKKYDFYQKAKASGVDGCLLVDIPLEESQEYQKNCLSVGIDPVYLISPSTPLDRIKEINQVSRGMVYYVCRKGTTGVKNSLPEDFEEKISRIKSVVTLPVIVGFGVSTAEMAKNILQYADGFVVASFFVKAMENAISSAEMTHLVKSLDPRKNTVGN